MTAKKSSNPAKRVAKPRSATSPVGPKASHPPKTLAEYRRKRDFSVTSEPEGAHPTTPGRKPPARPAVRASARLAFVIQKHAATSLHFDLRLELDDVMKSWAVPKGPSLDPAVKRLAMQVEDHPIEYNKFEGTIPPGEYGGGTVMLWDRGSYSYRGEHPDALEGIRRGYEKGDLKFVLRGKRLKGSWVLVRTRRGDPDRPQWLLIKHRDEYAEPGSDVVAEHQTSVTTGRTMEEIAAGTRRVWRSNRDAAAGGSATKPKRRAV